jgi:tetratricopeptide (TPR) repeat protein
MNDAHPKLGLALIVRDEATVLPGLLASIEGAFDQVALLDTGSRDATAETFRGWAGREAQRHPGFSWRLEDLTWSDDFALARNTAQELLSTDWVAWADADDELTGAASLREITRRAAPDVAAFAAYYDYARSPGGGPLVDQWRIRVVRKGRGRWRYPVHEQQLVEGRVEPIDPSVTCWVHTRSHHGGRERGRRNARLLRQWLRAEPDSLRALDYLGREEALAGHHDDAASLFRRYLELDPAWTGERVLVHRRLALSLIARGRLNEAHEVAAAAAAAMPEWADSYLTLAEIALERGDSDAAIAHAERALQLGRPDATIATAPAWYSLHPRVLLARALRQAGRADDAAQVAGEGLLAGFGGR